MIFKENTDRRRYHIVVLSRLDIPKKYTKEDQGNDQADRDKHDDDDHESVLGVSN